MTEDIELTPEQFAEQMLRERWGYDPEVDLSNHLTNFFWLIEQFRAHGYLRENTTQDPEQIVFTGPPPNKRPFTPNQSVGVLEAGDVVVAQWARKKFPEIPPEAMHIEIHAIMFEIDDETGTHRRGFEILWHMPDDEIQLVGNDDSAWLAVRTPNQLEFAAELEDVLPEIIAVATGLL